MIMVLCYGLASLAVAGCNTFNGIGKDISATANYFSNLSIGDSASNDDLVEHQVQE